METNRRLLISKDGVTFSVTDDKLSKGVHFWIRIDWDDFDKSYGGVEQHVAAKTGEKADHKNCWLILKPCKHDGSSLYAREVFFPIFWESIESGNYDRIWNLLEKRLEQCES